MARSRFKRGGASSSDFSALSSSVDTLETDLKGDIQSLGNLGSRGARMAFIFDDGYKNNLTAAARIMAEYGFAGTVAIESEKVGQNYSNDPVLPVLTAADMRSLISDYGWEICNHPNINIANTEELFASEATAENEFIVDLLTGAKVLSGSSYVSGSVTNPEFADYNIQGAVYRGGVRNDTVDSAFYTMYDKVRSINGTIAFSGDHVYSTDSEGKFEQHWTGFPADTNGDDVALSKLLSFVESLGASGNTAIIYAHDVPSSSSGSPSTAIPTPPYIHEAHLRKLCQTAFDNGVQIVPWRSLGKANLFHDSQFTNADSFSFSSGSGDTAAFNPSNTLNSNPNSIELTTTAYRANAGTTSFTCRQFQVNPFTRYKIKVRYKIDTDLTLNGGPANINHGLAMTFTTYQSNVQDDTGGILDDYNNAAGRGITYNRPYQATTGFDEWEQELYTGYGTLANVTIGLFQCTGTVYIGSVSIEKAESLIRHPLSSTTTFNTSLGKSVYFMSPPTSPSPIFNWEFRVLSPARTFDAGSDTTVDFAFSDSSLISPTSGQTVYVIGEGKNSFANQGGKLATWNGSSYSFSALSNNTFIKANNGQGIAPQYYVHRYANSEGGVYIPLGISQVYKDDVIVTKVYDYFFQVWNASATRTDTFQWVARPVWVR